MNRESLVAREAEAHGAPNEGLSQGRSGSTAARIVVAVVGVLFVAWIGLRVMEALREKNEVQVKRNEAAQLAAESANKPLVGKVVLGRAEQWQPVVPFEGTLVPANEADLGFKAAGRIRAVLVKNGQRVKAGAVLAELDSSEARAQANAARAQVQAAEAQLALASDANNRTSSLVRSGGVAEAAGVQSEHQQSLAVAQLEAARAQYELAKVAVANHVLTAPFAGSITRVPSGIGAVVGAGIPQFHLADLSTLKLSGTVSEGDAALIAVGAPVEVNVSGRVVEGKIAAVLGTVDPATRRVSVEAEVPNDAERPLLAGAFVRASVRGGAPIAVLRYPHEVLRPGSQDEVIVIEQGVMKPRRVQYTIATDGALLVRAGVTERDGLLLSPPAEAREGMKVEVAEWPSATAEKAR
jgi:RND family efflux transporter MFP subunit